MLEPLRLREVNAPYIDGQEVMHWTVCNGTFEFHLVYHNDCLDGKVQSMGKCQCESIKAKKLVHPDEFSPEIIELLAQTQS